MIFSLLDKSLLNVFSVLLLLSGVTNCLLSIHQKEDIGLEPKKEAESKKRILLKDVIQLAIVLLVFIGVFCFVVKYQIKVVFYFFIVLGILFQTITLGASVFEFVHYIFIKPFDFELTKGRENSLWMVGAFVLLMWAYLLEENMSSMIDSYILTLDVFVADATKMIILILWFFSIMFFELIFLVFLLRNLVVTTERKKKRESNIIRWMSLDDWKITFIAGKIWVKVEKSSKFKRCLYYILWVLCTFLDAMKSLLITTIECAYKVVVIILYFPVIVIQKLIAWIRGLGKNPAKIIMLSSRASLISSVLIVYLIDKYEKVFSTSGSEVYEFLCSVIIIPFLITQIDLLKNVSLKNKD